jgi:hypothetical protein
VRLIFQVFSYCRYGSFLVVSLLANDILAAVYGRHAPFYCKRTELTVTDSIHVTVDWSDREKRAECPMDRPFLLNRLQDYSLIRYIACKGQNTEAAETFWVHPLLHDWARVRLPKRKADAVELVALCLVNHSIEDADHFYYQQECNTPLLPHLDFSFHALMKRITADILDPWENRATLPDLSSPQGRPRLAGVANYTPLARQRIATFPLPLTKVWHCIPPPTVASVFL